MSLRRKSCDACFKGRRKCDRAFPACGRCGRNSKECRYLYPSDTAERETPDSIDSDMEMVSTQNLLLDLASDSISQPHLSQSGTSRMYSPIRSDGAEGMMDLLVMDPIYGSLGDLEPLPGAPMGVHWLVAELRTYPASFAQNAETIFLHQDLYDGLFPKTLRTAFGICAASVLINDKNRSVVLRTITAEVSGLLNPARNTSLLEDLSRMQALLLYQIIRLLQGDLRHRMEAEQQESLMTKYGYQLMDRAELELPPVPQTWEEWVLAESIRRTVMMTFLLYSRYSMSLYGRSNLYNAVKNLPVSYKPSLWDAKLVNLPESSETEVMPFHRFSTLWHTAPKISDSYQRVLLIACKGFNQFRALAYLAMPDANTSAN